MITKILNELAADNSRLAKESILKREKNNTTLKRVFEAAYNPYINYYIRQIPSGIATDLPLNLTLDDALTELTRFASREFTGNAAVNHLAFIMNNLNEDHNVIKLILQHDLECGVGIPTINKIWPGLIPTFEVMLAHKDMSGIKFPCYSQCKFDGARAHIYFDGEKVTAFSRNGKTFEIHGVLDTAARSIMSKGETWDGEFLLEKDGKIMDRKTGNGYLTKASRGTLTAEDATMLRFFAWDIVDFTETIPYKDRLEDLNNRFRSAFDQQLNMPFRMVQTVLCHNQEDADRHLQEMFDQGLEGTIVKNIDSVWQPKRTKDLGKRKAERSADLIVVDWKEGTGKYEGMMGALICRTSDDLLEVNVGTGFSDQERQDLDMSIIGKVIEVKYNELIKSKSEGSLTSMFLPRFVEVRSDKHQANSLAELN